MILPMNWLWILLRCLFPADPIRQGAEAIRHRVIQLVDTVNNDNWLPQLLADPAFRLYLEFLILDTEGCLRLWITMRGCQIAGVRCRAPWERMEELAQAYARRLTRLRGDNPLGAIRTACGPLRHDASHRATSLAFGEGGQALSSTGKAGGGGMRSMTEWDGRNAAGSRRKQGPPHSIAGANP